MKPFVIPINRNTVTLMPLGCIHWPLGDKALLNQFVERAKSLPDAKVILMGDSIDLLRTTVRSYVASYTGDSSLAGSIATLAEEQLSELAKVLAPIKGKIVGAIRGNHFAKSANNTNSEQHLAKKLGFPYLGTIGLLRFDMPWGYIKVLAHHDGGSKGGRTTGSDVSTMERAEAVVDDADVLLFSHTHRRLVVPHETVTTTSHGEAHVTHRTRILARTGALLKTYEEEASIPVDEPHNPTYGESALYRPTSLGWVEITAKASTHMGVTIPRYVIHYEA